jgi:restriction endonuclease S subunit
MRPLGEVLEVADSGTWGKEGSLELTQPVLRSSNIQDFKITFDNCAMRVIPKKDVDRKKLCIDDIIVTASSGSRELIGKCAIFRQPDQDNAVYYFSNFTLRLRADPEKIDPVYLYHWLISPAGRAHLTRTNDTTSGLRNLNKGLYLQQPIPSPPLIEQHRLAAILDHADLLREKRREAITKLDELLRSVFIEMVGDPVTNPKGWPQVEVQTISRIVRGSSPRPKGDPRYYGGPVPRLMVADVTRDGWLVKPRIDSLTEEGAKLSRPVKAGTIVMAVSGNVGVVGQLITDACIHDGFVAFTDLDEDQVSPWSLLMILHFLKVTHARRKAGAIFQNLTTNDIKTMTVPVPPREV